MEKEERYTVLVEDCFVPLNKLLRDPFYVKHSLLPGLIQRINNLNNPNIQTLCIERADILARALFFFCKMPICPLFEDISPTKLARFDIQNAYSLTFSMLFDEVVMNQKELLVRHEQSQWSKKTHRFIDVMYQCIEKRLFKLNQLLTSNCVRNSDNMLEVAIQMWLSKYNQFHQSKLYCELNSALVNFVKEYRNNMSYTDWLQKKEYIKNLCCQIEMTSNTEIFPNPPPEESVTIDNLFIARSDIRSKIYKCLLHLRLLLVDSHATLDILANAQNKIVVLAGNSHIRNINKYLSQLGFEQCNYCVSDHRLEPISLSI